MTDFFSVGPSTDTFNTAADASPVYVLPADMADAAKMQPVSGNTSDYGWVVDIIKAGVPKIIDNMTTRPTVTGSPSQGTAAGQSGQTYQMTPTPSAPVAPPSAQGTPKKSDTWVGLAIVAGLGLLALNA